MICRECGADNEQWRHYCGPCGAVLAPPQSSLEGEVLDALPLTTSGGSRDAVRAAPGARVRQGLGVAAPLAMLVKALPLLKFSKVLLTTGSMLVSVAVYAVSFGLSGAVGIVALLLVHELGHWAVLRYKGFGSSAIVFIPFVGAATAMRRLPTNVQDDAEIGLGGPITGTAGAFACLALGVGLHSSFWEVLAYLGLLLNLLNLVPMLPLDGGRIAAAISRWLWPLGLAVLVAVFALTLNTLVLLILVIGAMQTVSRFRAARRAGGMPSDYYAIAWRPRLVLGALYFGLLLVILLAMVTVQHNLGLSGSEW
jgi:Zn-dependent protease